MITISVMMQLISEISEITDSVLMLNLLKLQLDSIDESFYFDPPCASSAWEGRVAVSLY